MKTRLETVTNVAVLVACGLIGFQVIDSVVRRRAANPSGNPATASSRVTNATGQYRLGELVEPIAGVDYASADHSLLLFVKSTCRYCTESMPFYRRLLEAQTLSGGKVNVAAVSMEPVSMSRSYLERHDVRIATIATIREGVLKVSGTPTIVLVDRNGGVRRVWRGRLAPNAEKELMETTFGKPSTGILPD